MTVREMIERLKKLEPSKQVMVINEQSFVVKAGVKELNNFVLIAP